MRPDSEVYLDIQLRAPFDRSLASLETSIGERPWEFIRSSDDGSAVLVNVSGDGVGVVCTSTVVESAFLKRNIPA